MDKKKIIIAIVTVVTVIAVSLGFNSVFKKANVTQVNITEVNNKTILTDKDENTKQFVSTGEDDSEKEVSEEERENISTENGEDNSSDNSKDIINQKSSEKENVIQSEANHQTQQPEVKPQLEVKPQIEPQKQTVTIAINCINAIKGGVNKQDGFTHLPSNGIILSTMSVEFEEGQTVLDILVKATNSRDVHMEYRGGTGSSAYIEGIDNLYEFDGGPQSGWMYSVNGIYPNYGVGAYKVKQGDVINFNYTRDLGKDLGQVWP